MLRLRDILYKLYAERTGQPAATIAEDCERNKWLDAEEMVAYGLADKVLERLPLNAIPKKPKDDGTLRD